jgi:hypothetical protein
LRRARGAPEKKKKKKKKNLVTIVTKSHFEGARRTARAAA